MKNIIYVALGTGLIFTPLGIIMIIMELINLNQISNWEISKIVLGTIILIAGIIELICWRKILKKEKEIAKS